MAKEKLKKVSSDSLAKSLKKRKDKKLRQTLNFDSLVEKLHEAIETFPGNRKGTNLSKNFKNAALGGFAIFYTQSPSFLAYQKTMQEMRGQNNAQSLFGITEILSDNHIRTLLDGVAPGYVFPLFSYIFDSLNKSSYLDDEYRSFNNNILMGLDGTQYYSSSKVHCDQCNKKHHKNGNITYFHSVLTPVILKPGSNRVITLYEYVEFQKEDIQTKKVRRWVGQRCFVDTYCYV